ncbi:MAG TPA: alpha/beta hydrolase [Candidatus Babeliales bacterium]|nr:alpha/beta hydrolase [Candidatus Babeliales bacterium]
MFSGRFVLCVSLLFCVSLLYAQSVRFGNISKRNNYVVDGTLKKITFRVPESLNGKKSFVRRGELVVKPGARATVLIAHGYMCSMRDVAFLRWIFPGLNTLVFDFRAHGDHTNDQVCTFGHDEAYDVIAAVQFLKSYHETQNKPIIAYGFSMGAVSIIEALAKDPSLFIARILDCPFDSTENIIKRALSNMKFNVLGLEFPLPGRMWLQKHAYHPYVQGFLKLMLKTVAQMDAIAVNTEIKQVSPITSISKTSIPTFLIHCRNDEKIPVSAALDLYHNSRGFKRLWLTNGRRHFDSYFNDPEKYAHKIRRFIDKVLSQAYRGKSQAKIIEDPLS